MAEAVEEKILAPGPAGIPVKLVIVIGLAALLVGLGGAFAFLKLSGGHSGEGEKTGASTAKNDEHDGAVGKASTALSEAPGAIYDLEPFIVNLADSPEIRYLKVTIKLELSRTDAGAEIAARLPHIRDSILVLLTSKDSTTVRSPQGKFQLRDEITQRVNHLLPRPGVRAAYFTDFVVQ
ncbi:MAG: flagellar basal body-associated FliL family protein [Nitrospirota bacterium]